MSGCAPDEPPLPPVVWEGESVRVRMDDPEIPMCGGSFEALDRHATLTREALLLEGDDIIEYSVVEEDLVDSICISGTAAACALPSSGRVYTKIPFVPHEIVHAVRALDPRIGWLSSPLEEGMAMVYGDDFLPSWPIPLDISSILGSPRLHGEKEYFYAGNLVAGILDRHGMEAFREFELLAVSRGEDAAFVEVFGETKDELAEAIENGPVCEQTQWRVPLLECDGEPTTADPETGLLTFAGNVSCGESDVQGAVFDRMWTSRHFRLDTRTTIVSFDVDMPEDATLEIVGCNGGCPERVAYIGGIRDIGSINHGIPRFEPGEYFLRISRPVSDDDGHFEIVIDPL